MAIDEETPGQLTRTMLLSRARDAEDQIVALEESLRRVANILDEMKTCHDCMERAANGDPFCTSHALRLGGEVGRYLPTRKTTPEDAT